MIHEMLRKKLESMPGHEKFLIDTFDEGYMARETVGYGLPGYALGWYFTLTGAYLRIIRECSKRAKKNWGSGKVVWSGKHD